ncbi:ribonuclease E inhibitor RraB [Sulfurimonas sp.]|uniref:ribonuclease E inhibitor RraB n=1 Tax=Sulfurimonas sp. TaxID=2022749 RepID=UPI0025D90001|nr:ribonuclease E inhibitor RraB [Sulfurimonas sp.]MDD5157144.1 ribonuclease E inhibitor RraB [Sulfurimonas sp.]
MREIFSRIEDGKIVKIEVVFGAKEYQELNPWLFSVFIKYNSFNDSDDGIDEFFETKEALIIALEHQDQAHFVGNRLVDDWSELYFYAPDSKGLDITTMKILKSSGYVYESSVVKDAKWEFFDFNIFPTELEICIMQSNKIVELLEEEGDNLSIAREVEHYASFDTPTQKDRFVRKALDAGFVFKDDISSEEFDHGVALTKEHSLAEEELLGVIAEIFALIEEERGEYELWSTTLAQELE